MVCKLEKFASLRKTQRARIGKVSNAWSSSQKYTSVSAHMQRSGTGTLQLVVDLCSQEDVQTSKRSTKHIACLCPIMVTIGHHSNAPYLHPSMFYILELFKNDTSCWRTCIIQSLPQDFNDFCDGYNGFRKYVWYWNLVFVSKLEVDGYNGFRKYVWYWNLVCVSKLE